MTWDAINHELSLEGAAPIDFESFSSRYDQDSILQTLVKDFDKNRVVLKTEHIRREAPVSREKQSIISKIASKAVKLGK